jgi:hypothetical protein
LPAVMTTVLIALAVVVAFVLAGLGRSRCR